MPENLFPHKQKFLDRLQSAGKTILLMPSRHAAPTPLIDEPRSEHHDDPP
jgi:hypothetical protein